MTIGTWAALGIWIGLVALLAWEERGAEDEGVLQFRKRKAREWDHDGEPPSAA